MTRSRPDRLRRHRAPRGLALGLWLGLATGTAATAWAQDFVLPAAEIMTALMRRVEFV